MLGRDHRLLLFQGEFEASLKASVLQKQRHEEIVFKCEQHCADVIAAILGQCNRMQHAMQNFRQSCHTRDSVDHKLGSCANLFASVLDKLQPVSSIDNGSAEQQSRLREGNANGSSEAMQQAERTADALQLLASVMQQASNVFTAFADLDLNRLVQKKGEQIIELEQKLTVCTFLPPS